MPCPCPCPCPCYMPHITCFATYNVILDLLHAMQVPWGAGSTETQVRLQVAVLASPNDMLAEKPFTPFMGPGGAAFCSQCNYHKKKSGAGPPFSFFRPQGGIGKPAWKLRTQAQLDKQLDVAWSKGRTEKGVYCRKHGLRAEKVRCVRRWAAHYCHTPPHYASIRYILPRLVMSCSATTLFIPSTCRILISSR